MITDIFRSAVKSYRDLPKMLYHIQWKFRDEVRPRFGVMRGREFLMKDAYSFDLDYDGARRAYNKMFVAYLRTFARMGLKAIPMRADTGPIGGDLSHEFIILADTGESQVYCHRDFLDFDVLGVGLRLRRPGDRRRHRRALHAALCRAPTRSTTPSAFEPRCRTAGAMPARGIEVGHIFYFGTKYSAPLKAIVTGPTASRCRSRWAPTASASRAWSAPSSRRAMTTPASSGRTRVAPFRVGLINLRAADAGLRRRRRRALRQAHRAPASRCSTTTATRAPAPSSPTMDLIGLPWQLVVGPRGVKAGVVELKRRAGGERQELSADSALAQARGLSGQGRMIFSAFERMVAMRYLRARRQEGFISVIAGFSLLGIALGVATLIIVMSVMNGFRHELLGRILGLNGHIIVLGVKGKVDDFDTRRPDHPRRCRAWSA